MDTVPEWKSPLRNLGGDGLKKKKLLYINYEDQSVDIILRIKLLIPYKDNVVIEIDIIMC